jgi:hypothetical protein
MPLVAAPLMIMFFRAMRSPSEKDRDAFPDSQLHETTGRTLLS